MGGCEVLSTGKFRKSFYGLVSRRPARVRIAVPYVGKVPGFGSLADFARIVLRDDASMELITRPPGSEGGTITKAMAEVVVSLGVDLVIRHKPPLHAKIYQVTFGDGSRTAYVGSANLSEGGLKRNDEAMALFHSAEENKRVEAELNRLSGYGAVPYRRWLANSASGV